MSNTAAIQIRLTVHPGADFDTLTVEHVATGQLGEFYGSVADFQAEAAHFGENIEIVEVVGA